MVVAALWVAVDTCAPCLRLTFRLAPQPALVGTSFIGDEFKWLLMLAGAGQMLQATLARIKTNRFHVAVGLFSDRSHKTSKFSKNKKVSLMFLPHFDIFCDILLNRHTATWNLFVKL